MGTWVPRLPPPLPERELEGILHDACRVLQEIGVECRHAGTRLRLAELGGVTLRHDRVHFAPEPLRDRVALSQAAGKAAGPQPDGPLTLGACWACLFYCDPESGQVRPASSEEAAAMARLWDARGLRGPVPVVPGDVPPALVTLASERIALTHSALLGGGLTVTDPEEVRHLMAMNLAAGRRYRLLCQVSISPLRLNAEALETAVTFLDHPDVDVDLGGAIPMAGATCPLEPRSAAVQSLAEALAFDRLAAALGRPEGLSLRIEPFDFQYSTIVFGSPEWCLYRALVLQLTGWLAGHPATGGSFRSTAKQPDAQAASERTASVLWQALLGVRHFGAVGQLSVDEVFSPQQAVIDREILAYVDRVAKGMDAARASGDPVELIRRGMAEGSFAGLPETVGGYREFCTFPELFRHWNVGRWRAEGQPSVLGEAWTRARAEAAASTHALGGDAQQRVDRLYEDAVAYVRRRKWSG